MIFDIWEFTQREIAAETLLPRITVQYIIEK